MTLMQYQFFCILLYHRMRGGELPNNWHSSSKKLWRIFLLKECRLSVWRDVMLCWIDQMYCLKTACSLLINNVYWCSLEQSFRKIGGANINFSLKFLYSFEHPGKEWTVYKRRFMVVQIFPWTCRKGMNILWEKGQARFFCAFFAKYFFKILDFKTLLWPPGDMLVVLQYSEECSSAFLNTKKFENQYCVGPTYTNFFRNRASVSRFS